MDDSQPAMSEPDSGARNITLNILSPSTEVPDKLTFSDCTPSTTVADLKSKIQNAVATRPAPERQRLIYRGRPLVQDTATLADVFTPSVISVADEFSLHLVLPPAIAPRAPQASSVPAAGTTTAQRSSYPMAPETGRVAATLQQQGAHGHRIMPHMPHMPFMQPQPGLNVPLPMPPMPPMPPGQFPPHLQTALQNHLQALGQQIGAQMAMHGNQVGQGPLFNANQGQGLEQQQPFPPSSFQQIVAQQQQARAAAGRQGAGDNAGAQETNMQAEVSGQTPRAATPAGEQQNPSTLPPNTYTALNNNQSNNGEGWRMVIQSTSTVTGVNPNLQRVPTPVNIALQQPPGAISQPAPPIPIPLQGPGNAPMSTPNQMQLQILEQEISAIQTTLTRGTAPAPSVFDNARTMLRNIENINAAPGLEAMFRTQIDTLAAQADHLRMTLNRMLMQVVTQQPGSQSAPPSSNIEPSPSHRNPMPFSSPSISSPSSSVYILSSPNGPQALLVSPAGTYRAPWPMSQLDLTAQHSRHNRAFNHLPNNNNNNHNHHVPPGPQQPRMIPANGAQAHQHQRPAAPQQQQGNEVRDLLRLLLPLGGHLWLLIRLFGFVFFFTAGGGFRRALLLGSIAFVVFVAQTGIFRPLIQAV
ncbi:MAG: hypothetical protein Q9191_006252, partial [Dirinaria sp. TL-2023a]